MPSNRLIAFIKRENRNIVAKSEVKLLNSNCITQGKCITSIHIHEKFRATTATIICIANLTRAGIAYFLCIKYPNSSIIATKAIIAPHINNHKKSRPNEISSLTLAIINKTINKKIRTTHCNVGTGFLSGTSFQGLSSILKYQKILRPLQSQIHQISRYRANKNQSTVQ